MELVVVVSGLAVVEVHQPGGHKRGVVNFLNSVLVLASANNRKIEQSASPAASGRMTTKLSINAGFNYSTQLIVHCFQDTGKRTQLSCLGVPA